MSNKPASNPPELTPAANLARPQPGFGWTAYAEQLNGRFAMIGFFAVVLIEIITGQGLISWLGF